MMRSIARLFRQGRSTAIIVPRPIMHALQWQNGVEVHLDVIGGKLIVQELEQALLERAKDRLPSPAAGAPAVVL